MTNGFEGAIPQDAVDQDLKAEHGDTGNGRDGHESLGSVNSVGDSVRGGPDRGDEHRDQKRTSEGNSVALQGSSRLSGGEWGRVSIPVMSPQQKSDDAEGRAEILKNAEPGTRPKDGKLDILLEHGQVIGKPISGVGKRVPEDVGGNAHENGENDQGKPGNGVYGKGPGTEMESFASTSGQTGGEGLLGVAMKEPEHCEA